MAAENTGVKLTLDAAFKMRQLARDDKARMEAEHLEHMQSGGGEPTEEWKAEYSALDEILRKL